ncbi:hypothetical protein, partial [Providencia stuartii]|uniref:hypothetical protein n=1 Tax=Providencia stuartii TaxID=588 RepID=UPI0013D50066
PEVLPSHLLELPTLPAAVGGHLTGAEVFTVAATLPVLTPVAEEAGETPTLAGCPGSLPWIPANAMLLFYY